MKLAIVTDAACDLAANFIEDYNIHVLPVKIIKGNTILFDLKDSNFITEVREDIKNNGKFYRTEPLNIEEMKEHLLKLLTNPEIESFLFILSSSSRSRTYSNVVSTMAKIIPEVRSVRQHKNLKSNIKFEIIDSMQLSTGLGVLISETVINIKKELNFEEIIQKVHESIAYTQAFLIPETLTQLYNQAGSKGDSSVGLGSYLLGTTLDIKPIIQSYKGVTRAVDKVKGFDKAFEMIVKLLISDIRNNRLKFKNIALSYGGDANKRKDLIESPAYIKLKEVADLHSVSITLSKMGATMMVNVGANAISVGYISANIAHVQN